MVSWLRLENERLKELLEGRSTQPSVLAEVERRESIARPSLQRGLRGLQFRGVASFGGTWRSTRSDVHASAQEIRNFGVHRRSHGSRSCSALKDRLALFLLDRSFGRP